MWAVNHAEVHKDHVAPPMGANPSEGLGELLPVQGQLPGIYRTWGAVAAFGSLGMWVWLAR